ncbi:unnamed protein product [Ceutorhynchus assimilis]|uniref:Lipase n=1 Tax=Ceutorhynchus assimilis TaxID=467358 RepID=A0A9N9ML65_9CUCU|nr:unnamed protein product [Ceutorhynchus assimilis]
MLREIVFRQIIAFIVASNALIGNLLNFRETTTVDMLQQFGYPVETHQVSTEDGYELTLHRIPYGKSAEGKTPAKKPILLVHGLLCSSADWIVTGEHSLGLQLANAGYDVWMGNNRGNTYSRKHKKLSPDSDGESFFSFSFHEFGKYDAPAMIEYVLKNTNTSKIPYVGYSQGTTQFLVMMSERPEYNDKISSMVSWAPVTEMSQTNNKLINLLRDVPVLEEIGDTIRWNAVLQHEKIGNLYKGLCKLSDTACSLVFRLLGQSLQRMPNIAMKQKILSNFPAGTCKKELLHYVQGARDGIFRPYDYGMKQNLKVYGKPSPDPYNLSKVRCNMTLFYGDADDLVNNDKLLNYVIPELTNANVETVPLASEFNHLDFIWGKHVQYLNEKTLEVLKHDSANRDEVTDELTKIDTGTHSISTEEIRVEHTIEEE